MPNRPRKRRSTIPAVVYQFRITLMHVEPAIWRVIEVPGHYSFWDLHIAVNDAMGWLDYHLHAFSKPVKGQRLPLTIGVPDEEWDDPPTLAGWDIPISRHFKWPGDTMSYEYDFGDVWFHNIVLESIALPTHSNALPRCVAGERACPPEDCGGPSGYIDLVSALNQPNSQEYEGYKHWLSVGHAKNYWPFEPDVFQPRRVRFDDPQERWTKAFTDDEY